jgi:hypothetical protein
MRIGSFILTLVAFTASLHFTADGLVAANIDGKWKGKGQQAAGKDASRELTAVLELKADGKVLKGTAQIGGRRARAVEIQDGQIDGDSFSFTTVVKNKKGDRTVKWTGTVKGDEMELSPSGRRRGAGLTLKRETGSQPNG